MRTFWIVAAASLLATSLTLTGCSDDDDDGGGQDAGDGSGQDVGEMDAGGEEDVMADADTGPTGTGSISGQVFYNGDPIEGSLTVALFEEFPSDTAPAVFITDDAPEFHYSYTLEGVPVGTEFVVVAIFDVDDDEDDPFTAGMGDLFGLTMSTVSLAEDGGTLDNINVEIR